MINLREVRWAVYGLYCSCESCALENPERIKYIGQTRRDAFGRLAEHRKNVRKSVHDRIGGLPIYKWMRKHGAKNIQMKILGGDLDESLIDDVEKHWIKFYGTFGSGGYNMTNGGLGKSGYRHSDETKRIISEKKRGVPGFSKSGLTEGQVLEIKARLWDGETQTELAIEYGVSKKTLADISQGKVKNHVPWPIGPRRRPRTSELLANRIAERERDDLGRIVPSIKD